MKVSSMLIVVLALLVLVVGGAVYHRHAVAAGGRRMQGRLNATVIDVNFRETSLAEAFREVHRKLAEKDPVFEEWEFLLVHVDAERPISMELSGVPGSECLVYLAQLSGGNTFRLRPGKVILTHGHADTRDGIERAVMWGEDSFRRARLWLDAFWSPGPSDPFSPTWR